MKRHYEIKNLFTADFKGMIQDVDFKSRTVTGYFSRFGNIDSDGDMMMPGSLTKSINERGLTGKNILPHIIGHKIHDPLMQLSKPKLYEKADGGYFESTISDTTNGIDILKLYRDGVINQHSFGFKTLKNQQKSGYTEIQEVMMYEISTVTLGANDQTPFTGFKGLKDDELIEQYNTLTSAWDNGDYSDDVFPILKAQIRQIEQDIINRYISLKTETTLPGSDEPTKPEQPNELKTAIDLLIIKHF